MKNTVAAGLFYCSRFLLDRSEFQKTVSLQIKTLRGLSGPVPSSTLPGEVARPDTPSAKP